MDITRRVARRFINCQVRLNVAFKYEPKETKAHKVDRLKKTIRDATGLSGGVSEQIADAYVRGRDVAGLAVQKGWPIDGGVITGDGGSIALEDLSK